MLLILAALAPFASAPSPWRSRSRRFAILPVDLIRER
jgi:hypothetical protein